MRQGPLARRVLIILHPCLGPRMTKAARARSIKSLYRTVGPCICPPLKAASADIQPQACRSHIPHPFRSRLRIAERMMLPCINHHKKLISPSESSRGDPLETVSADSGLCLRFNMVPSVSVFLSCCLYDTPVIIRGGKRAERFPAMVYSPGFSDMATGKETGSRRLIGRL
jgi:hypothetical protein